MSRPATPDAGSPPTGPSLERRVRRLTLLIVALSVLVTGLGGYLASRLAAVNATDSALLQASRAALDRLGPSPDPADVDRFLRTGSGVSTLVTVVVRADGDVVRVPGSDTLVVQGGDVAVAAGRSEARTHPAEDLAGNEYRVRAAPVGQATGLAVLVARPLATVQQILGALALALTGFGVAVLLAAWLVGRRVARAGIAPVRELITAVEDRAAAGALEPVRVTRDDELGRLAVAFNHLLDTIQVSRVQQSRFVADAGHELRTPLTSMRTNIELLTVDAEHAMLSSGDRVTIMRDVRAQLIEFSELVSDLVGLTREDRTAADFDQVDLSGVIDEVVDRVSMRSIGLAWSVDLEPTDLQGDADLLARAFTNMLDNAVKYSPPGGTVTVTLHDGELRIGDEGRGVTADEKPFVFDRFYRSEASRAAPGTGLGLSITYSVVRQHGGSVRVTDATGGGAVFVVTFPLAVRRPSGRGAAAADDPDALPPLALGGV